MATAAMGGASEQLKSLLIALCADPASTSHGCSGFFGQIQGEAEGGAGGTYQKIFEARYRSTRLKKSEVGLTYAGAFTLVFPLQLTPTLAYPRTLAALCRSRRRIVPRLPLRALCSPYRPLSLRDNCELRACPYCLL